MEAGRHMVLQGHMTWRQGNTWCCRNTRHGGREIPGAAGTHDMEAERHLVLQEHMTWRQGNTWCCRNT